MDAAAIARAVTARIEQRLAAANAAHGQSYVLSLSVGVASESHARRADGSAPPTLEDLLANADAALYEEKCRRKARLTT